MTPRGFPGRVRTRCLMMLNQAQGAALQMCSTRSEFAGRFPANSHERSAQTGIGLGRTLVRIGRRWAALRTTLLRGAVGPSLLEACRGHPETSPRRRGPTGGPGKGERSSSRVEGQVGAGRPPQPCRTAEAPKVGEDLTWGTKVSLPLRLLRSRERHRLRQTGRGSRGSVSGVPRCSLRWTGHWQP